MLAAASSASQVLRVGQGFADALQTLLARFDVELDVVPDSEEIPASYWGEPEAGVVNQRVHARGDTPVHSVLHEAAHVICASPARRSAMHKDAGGDDAEEAAVCYLQILLADLLPDVGAQRLMRDMDAWGYSFRLGSAARWFHEDADDAGLWLERAGIVDRNRRVTFRLR